MQAIGIDIGTTSICGVVVDTETGKLIHSRTENSNAFICTENEWEKIQDVEKIIALAIGILDDFICEDTVSIGVTGQMHGIVYTDKNGKAVSPLYTWQDGRGDLPYNGTTYAEYLGSCSGYGNVTDFYNRVNSIVPFSAESYCTIHDYLVMQLCGLKKAVVHTSDAASFGCFDLESKTFSYDNYIQVTDGFTVAGCYKGIPVAVAIGDNQASVFSSLSSDSELLLNFGTGSQVSVVSDSIVIAENIETRPYFDGKYLVVGSALCGGRAYAVLKDFYKKLLSYAVDITDSQVYGIMDNIAKECHGSTLSVDTRFSGTRADNTIRGSIRNISTENFTPAQLSYGVMMGMVNELYELYSKMNTHCRGVVASGNGIRKNPTLMRIAEVQFNNNIKIPCHTEEASFGAALFGMVAAGICKNTSQAQGFIQYI